MTTKLRIKVGRIEFEYEGDSDFSQSSIKDLFSHIEALFKTSGSLESLDESAGSAAKKAQNHSGAINLHTNSIASKISAETGPDLALAAAAYLQLVKQKDKFSRQELLVEMKSATSRYKQSMSSNLSKILETLVNSHKFNQLGTGTYALEAKELASLRERLVA